MWESPKGNHVDLGSTPSVSTNMAPSYNGNTVGFRPTNLGSIPSGVTNVWV